MHQMLMLFPGGKTHALTLSYDDGVAQDIRLVGLMKQYGVKGTFNISSACFAPDDEPHTQSGRLNRAQCLELYDPAICEVALHTRTHAQLNALPAGAAAYEVLGDRLALEEMFDRPIRGLAYPVSQYSADVVAMLRSVGVCYARGGSDDHRMYLPDDYLRWMPTCRHRDPALMDVADDFLSRKMVYTGPYLFMLMGHSFEFDQAGNWHVIERFLQKMSGRENVWYATCQEIYDAHAAYKRLVCSADGKRIYNPSHASVWARIDQQPVEIPGGQMIRL